MGVDVELWRARIGLFNGGKGGRLRHASLTNQMLHCDVINIVVAMVLLTQYCSLSLFLAEDATSNCEKSVIESLLNTCHDLIRNRAPPCNCCYEDVVPERKEEFTSHHSSNTCFRRTITVILIGVIVVYSFSLLLLLAGDVELNPGPGMDTVLTSSDLLEVCEKVRSASPNWFDLGLVLKLSYTDLANFRDTYREKYECLREALAHRLQSGGSLTWEGICTALRHPTVARNDVAEKIEEYFETQPRDLTMPVAATPKPRTFSTPEDVSQPTSIRRFSASDYDYLSCAGDGLPSMAVSMTSLCSPTHAGRSDFPHDLQWNTRSDIPALQKMSSPIDAAVHGDTAYFRPYRSRKIFSYNLNSGWSKSAKCLVRDASLVVLPVPYNGADHFLLHTIGGIIYRQNEDKEEFTNDIYQLTIREWTRSITYPKLKTKRSQITVVFSYGYLIIAGGNSAHGIIQTVDVLNQHKVWHEVACLPYKVFRASGCVCNGMLYILGGYVVNEEGDIVPTRNACVATVSEIIQANNDGQGIFKNIQNLEFKTSACVSFRNHLMAIGGWKFNTETGQQKGTKLVHVYHTGEDVWKELKGQLSRPRCLGFAAAFEDKQKIMIVGGYNRPYGTCTDSVEFAIIP